MGELSNLKANIVRLLFYKVKSNTSPNDTNILKVKGRGK